MDIENIEDSIAHLLGVCRGCSGTCARIMLLISLEREQHCVDMIGTRTCCAVCSSSTLNYFTRILRQTVTCQLLLFQKHGILVTQLLFSCALCILTFDEWVCTQYDFPQASEEYHVSNVNKKYFIPVGISGCNSHPAW